MSLHDHLQLYLNLGLTPVPLRFRSKQPLVRWGNGWDPTREELKQWFLTTQRNVGIRCGEHLAAIDCDSDTTFRTFTATHNLPPDCPVVKTGRGYHIWMKPKNPIKSQRVNGLEIKCLGSYVVAPPSIHPSGVPYVFEIAPNGALPEVDLETLLGLPTDSAKGKVRQENIQSTPNDFALRYGKSPYSQSLCGRATKVLTRSDGKVKHLLSLRCWKWHCPKCAPLLKRYWLGKLESISFRFILRLPTMDKPTALLRRVGKPGYAHVVANGESWLFLTNGEVDRVWAEARQAGCELVAGDVSGDPSQDKKRGCLEQALCLEEEPLNTRRKITHSRELFRKACQSSETNESKQNQDCAKGDEDTKGSSGKERLTWDSRVFIKPIDEVAEELEAQGWRVFWKSEVEAIAIKDDQAGCRDMDIVELMDNLGIRLRKVGNEYIGLCPFHEDHKPSLCVNREKGLWHCFGCGRGGDIRKFIAEWGNSVKRN